LQPLLGQEDGQRGERHWSQPKPASDSAGPAPGPAAVDGARVALRNPGRGGHWLHLVGEWVTQWRNRVTRDRSSGMVLGSNTTLPSPTWRLLRPSHLRPPYRRRQPGIRYC
jgi:hypothetical protein